MKLLEIYNQIWTSETVPTGWTEALAVPILKPRKDPDFATSYRPIALTSCACKVMEKLVNNRLTHFLEEKGYLPMEQYGFRKNRSTEDVHTILESEIQEAFRINNISC
jgi:hypothetical protein